MIATGYVRRSAKSDENTVSLQEQQRQIEDYCAKQGFTLAAVVSHDGVSGAKRSRWDDIIQSIRGNESRVLVIYNLDRLSRDVSGLLDNLRALTAIGITVHEVSSGVLDLSKSTSKLTISVRGVMDEFFRDTVSEKTRDALRYKRENGQRYTHIPPLGFAYHNGQMIAQPEEQRALRIIADCASQGLGARKIRTELIKAGYRGRMGIATIHRTIKDKLPAQYFSLIDNR